MRALGALRDAVASLPTEGASERARDLRIGLLAELQGHIIPRLAHPDSPVIVALCGPTGAGKSTLINSLARGVVSPAGPLRPTTRTPVLVHRPEEGRWFPGDRRRMPSWDAVHPVVSPHLPPGVALLDTPDADSARSGQQGDTRQLIAAAEVWLVLTTAARYADALTWQTLRSAGGRQTDLAVLLDRVPAGSRETVEGDLRQLLDGNGLAGAPLLVVLEASVTDGRIPEPAFAPVRSWLETLATGQANREEVVQRSLAGALEALDEPLRELGLGGRL